MEPMASSGFGYPEEEPMAPMGPSGTNYPEEWGESWPQSNGMGLDDFFEQQMMDMMSLFDFFGRLEMGQPSMDDSYGLPTSFLFSQDMRYPSAVRRPERYSPFKYDESDLAQSSSEIRSPEKSLTAPHSYQW